VGERGEVIESERENKKGPGGLLTDFRSEAKGSRWRLSGRMADRAAAAALRVSQRCEGTGHGSCSKGAQRARQGVATRQGYETLAAAMASSREARGERRRDLGGGETSRERRRSSLGISFSVSEVTNLA